MSDNSDDESDSANSTQSNANNTNTKTIQQFVTTSVGNSNAKLPYLQRGEYEIWTMKMENWIKNTDHNLWNIVLKGNSKKKKGKEKKGPSLFFL